MVSIQQQQTKSEGMEAKSQFQNTIRKKKHGNTEKNYKHENGTKRGVTETNVL